MSVVNLVSWKELGASEAPLALAASQALGNSAFTVLSIIALFATANTVLILMIVCSRVMYGMAVNGALPRALAKIHGKRGTPHFSVITVTTLSMLFVLLGDIKIVAGVTNFATFMVFSSVNLSLILLRHAEPDLERPFRVPLNMGKHSLIPFLGLFSCVFLIFQLDPLSILLAILILITGGIVHKVLKRRKVT